MRADHAADVEAGRQQVMHDLVQVVGVAGEVVVDENARVGPEGGVAPGGLTQPPALVERHVVGGGARGYSRH
jgi:hypothetical protein